MSAERGEPGKFPVLYVGQHETLRAKAVTGQTLSAAQACDVCRRVKYVLQQSTNLNAQYDTLTAPITTVRYKSRVFAFVSDHIKSPERHRSSKRPLLSHLSPEDTAIGPDDHTSQLLAVSSPWIDLESPDPLVADISRQVLKQEFAYAAFSGVGNVVVNGPHAKSRSGLSQYARAILEALSTGPYLQISLLMPMAWPAQLENEIDKVSIASLGRDQTTPELGAATGKSNPLSSWETWDFVRTMCRYHSRLFIGKNGLQSDKRLPSFPLLAVFAHDISRWVCIC